VFDQSDQTKCLPLERSPGLDEPQLTARQNLTQLLLQLDLFLDWPARSKPTQTGADVDVICADDLDATRAAQLADKALLAAHWNNACWSSDVLSLKTEPSLST